MNVEPQAAAEPEALLRARYEAVRERIAQAARRAGRQPDDICLVAVTKNAEPDQIRSLIAMGQRDFGENHVQSFVQRAAMTEELLARQRVLGGGGSAAGGASMRLGPGQVRWHLIGHLQRNKVRKAVEFARLIHSVDSLRLAEEIQLSAQKRSEPIEVLVQVNCSGEASKFGCPVAAARHLVEQIDTMVGVRVRGLMTMAAESPDPAVARAAFSQCREIFDEVKKAGVGEGRFNILSMGMSSDFEIAIAEGANIVRVGSAIFGERQTPEPTIEDEPE
ncbi:MAG: YggS family pyridoxal phosphate-dependent enzyme [Phycisphaerales bacterium]